MISRFLWNLGYRAGHEIFMKNSKKKKPKEESSRKRQIRNIKICWCCDNNGFA